MKKLIIVVGVDHAGVSFKEKLQKNFRVDELILEWRDVGTFNEERVDYPDFASKVVEEVVRGRADVGVLICGSGIGMSIAANRNKRIRAAMIYSDETAALARQHNDANVACFGSRTQRSEDIMRWLKIFLSTPYEGGRHDGRIKKLS